jgi:mono/diheme cytochrome c family protein
MVGLTEERSAQIVRKSGNARSVVFLGVLIIALFIPVYWFYENGIPAVGAGGRLEAEADAQYVTDVSRGYELYIANCARCHGEEGKGGIGPPLNDQAKLYNAVTPDGQSGSGHLNPHYLDQVLTVGGRYVCGDPNSLMAAWKQPDGPLNYREVEELIAWLVASSDVVVETGGGGHGATAASDTEPAPVRGWRDPNWQPEPGATPPPACWRNPSGVIGGSAPPPASTPAPAATPAPGGSAAPVVTPVPGEARVIELVATGALQFTDTAGNQVRDIPVTPGETVTFRVDNTAGFDHNFYIGTDDQLMVAGGTTDTGIPTWQSGVQELTWTVPADISGLKYGCTVPGHYTLMQGTFSVAG